VLSDRYFKIKVPEENSQYNECNSKIKYTEKYNLIFLKSAHSPHGIMKLCHYFSTIKKKIKKIK